MSIPVLAPMTSVDWNSGYFKVKVATSALTKENWKRLQDELFSRGMSWVVTGTRYKQIMQIPLFNKSKNIFIMPRPNGKIMLGWDADEDKFLEHPAPWLPVAPILAG